MRALWFYDNIAISILVSLGGGFVAGLAAGIIVKFRTKTTAEKTFEENSKLVYDDLFSRVSRIDTFKQAIYKIWEKPDFFKNTDMSVSLTPHNHEEIQRYEKLILDELKAMTFHRNSPYVFLPEYLLLQQYSLSAYYHWDEIGNEEHRINIDKKSLEFHRFYAKKIIETFKDFVPKDFIDKWELEFERMGGSQLITEPSLEPGDAPKMYLNLRNETLYFDAQHHSIIELLRDIKNDDRPTH